MRTLSRAIFISASATATPVDVAAMLAGLGVNRLTLREILLTGIEDVVHFGKAFDRYEELDDGCVRAHFADGSSADGSLPECWLLA
ncbi:hypothetical protein ACFQ1S_40585, partial [Kibdelosporangium lantanae]